MKISELRLDGIGRCYPNIRAQIDDTYGKKNVFMGVGVWSNKYGLSKGLPICVLSMLLMAHQLRQQLNPEKPGLIHVLLADSLALESMSAHPDINRDMIIARCEEYHDRLQEVCRKLKIDGVRFIRSSDIVTHSSYLEIERDIKESQAYVLHVLNNRELQPSHQNYILKQTALVAYYASIKNCALKISWCQDETSISKGLMSKAFDEPWFDAHYDLLLPRAHPIGFVYTHSGIQLNPEQSTTCVPYCAANDHDTRLFLGDTLDQVQIKIPKNKTHPERYDMSRKLKREILALLNSLRAFMPITSGKNESHYDLILEDLAKITALGMQSERVPHLYRSKSAHFWSMKDKVVVDSESLSKIETQMMRLGRLSRHRRAFSEDYSCLWRGRNTPVTMVDESSDLLSTLEKERP